jgi:predicted nucleic acid-binding protein
VTRVLFDANVVLDVLLSRAPHLAASSAALDTVVSRGVDGLIAAHAVTTIAYLVQREHGAQEARAILGHLLARLRVAEVSDAVVRAALAAAMPDFEDAVTSFAARDSGATLIVTRDPGGFVGSPIPAVSPEAFLAHL